MKKSLFVLSLLSVLGMGLLFTSGAKNKVVSITGQINYYGNAPVAVPAFKADDGKIYGMVVEEGAKFTLNDVLALQGDYLELTGIVDVDALAYPLLTSGTITIQSYKQAKAKKK